MRKSNCFLVVVYWAALFLVCFPMLKQSMLSYKLTKVSVVQTKVVEQPLQQAEAVQPPTFSEILAFQGTELPTSAKLLIPSADFLVPIYPAITQETLLAGGGMLFPEREPANNNVVLMGHHLGNQQLLFGQLLSLKKKDELYLHYANEVYHYQVTATKIIQETDLSVLAETPEPQLTLITCDKPSQTNQRFVVTASLQKRSQATSKIILREEKLEKTTTDKNIRDFWVTAGLFFCLLVIGTGLILRLLREETNQ